MDPLNAVFYTWWLQAADDALQSGGRALRRSRAADERAYYRRNGMPQGWPRGLGPLGIAAALLVAILVAGWTMDLVAT